MIHKSRPGDLRGGGVRTPGPPPASYAPWMYILDMGLCMSLYQHHISFSRGEAGIEAAQTSELWSDRPLGGSTTGLSYVCTLVIIGAENIINVHD